MLICFVIPAGAEPSGLGFGSSSVQKQRSSDFASCLMEQSFRPAGGQLFFAGTKKSHQKKVPMEIKSASVGRTPRGFSDSPSWLGRKTAHIVRFAAKDRPALLARAFGRARANGSQTRDLTHVRRPSGLHAAWLFTNNSAAVVR